jgi:hypothetical protein
LHQVDHDASVLKTVTHGILSSSAFYFSCPVGLAYSSLNQRDISIPHSTIITQFSEWSLYCTSSPQKYCLKNALQIVTDH